MSVTDVWCGACGAPAAFRSASLDPRHPLVHCPRCQHDGPGVTTAEHAGYAAQWVHDHEHAAGCPKWCTRAPAPAA